MVSLSAALIASGVFLLIVLHVAALGYWVTRWLRYSHDDVWTQFAVRGGVGIASLGFEALLLGHLGLLTRPVFFLSSAAMTASLAAARPRVALWAGEASRQVSCAARQDRVLGVSCALMLLLVFAAGLRHPYMIDEIQYHWAAPLMWARQHHWMTTPYHSTDGPVLMEMIYTFCALFGSATAAHWTHSLTLLVLMAGSAALSRSLGAPVIASVAACLACPILVEQSTVAYNDVAAAALTIAAYAALLTAPDAAPRRPAVMAAGLLFMGAASIKPYTLAALPVAAAYLAWPLIRQGKVDRPSGVRLGTRLVLLVVPAVLALGFWTARSRAMTGHTWQSEYQGLTAHSKSDPIWHNGEAVARVPTAGDIAELPFDPAIMTVMGNKEPYGGRPGLLLWLVPLGVIAALRLPAAARRRAQWLGAGAGAYFLLLGAVILKTRFHSFVWTACTPFEALAFGRLCGLSAVPARLGRAVFYLLVWLGMADAAHVLLGLAHSQ